eukprot:scaffold177866_cov17-Tisochrysis_lutea.AAC.1
MPLAYKRICGRNVIADIISFISVFCLRLERQPANGRSVLHQYATSLFAQVTRDGVDTELRAKGRHDACVVPRAVPMVESMVALVLADQMLQHYAQVRVSADGVTRRWPIHKQTWRCDILQNVVCWGGVQLLLERTTEAKRCKWVSSFASLRNKSAPACILSCGGAVCCLLHSTSICST